MRRMLKIAVTGGIGAGKTIVCQIFSLLGIEVYNADIEAKKLLFRDDIKIIIFDRFGHQIEDDNGQVNKAKLANIVFNDASKLKQLNGIMHPEVKLNFLNWADACINKRHKYVILESAIVLESGFNSIIDKTVVVISDMQTRLKRVALRDKLPEQDIQKRMKQQLDEQELIKIANYIVYNNDKELLISQVMKIHKELIGYQ